VKSMMIFAAVGGIITIFCIANMGYKVPAISPSIMIVGAAIPNAKITAAEKHDLGFQPIGDTNEAGIVDASIGQIADSPEADVSSILGNFPFLKSTHDKLLSQGRDQRWADASEEKLTGFIRDIPGAGDLKNRVTVRCGTTLCEVTGELNDPDHEYDRRLDAGMSDIEFTAQMSRNGFRDMGSGRGPGRDGRLTFVAYYQREVPTEDKPQRRVPDAGL